MEMLAHVENSIFLLIHQILTNKYLNRKAFLVVLIRMPWLNIQFQLNNWSLQKYLGTAPKWVICEAQAIKFKVILKKLGLTIKGQMMIQWNSQWTATEIEPIQIIEIKVGQAKKIPSILQGHRTLMAVSRWTNTIIIPIVLYRFIDLKIMGK